MWLQLTAYYDAGVKISSSTIFTLGEQSLQKYQSSFYLSTTIISTVTSTAALKTLSTFAEVASIQWCLRCVLYKVGNDCWHEDAAWQCQIRSDFCFNTARCYVVICHLESVTELVSKAGNYRCSYLISNHTECWRLNGHILHCRDGVQVTPCVPQHHKQPICACISSLANHCMVKNSILA